MRLRTSQRGTILILALWSLGLLTVFAVSLGMRVRQKIFLVSRVEKRIQVYDAAEAGIRKAIALLKSEMTQHPLTNQKTVLFNSPEFFKTMALGTAAYEVSYMGYDNAGPTYGIVDEERKINVNTADRLTLGRLFENVTDLSKEAREDLVNAIIDWHEYGESEADGFIGDAYYESLKFPYKQKKGDFETLDELLLVKGMTVSVYRQLSPFITVYGSGKVNLNTAPQPVLKALGMSDALVKTILFVRRGNDGQEATIDDIIFPAGSEAPMLQILMPLVEREDLDYVFELYANNKIGLESSHYMIQSRGYLKNMKEKKDLACVFDLNSGKIKYWREY